MIEKNRYTKQPSKVIRIGEATIDPEALKGKTQDEVLALKIFSHNDDATAQKYEQQLLNKLGLKKETQQ